VKVMVLGIFVAAVMVMVTDVVLAVDYVIIMDVAHIIILIMVAFVLTEVIMDGINDEIILKK
jgi:hypothetical protein